MSNNTEIKIVNAEEAVNNSEYLNAVFNEVTRWENSDRELAQGRSNFQIEKFIALEGFTIPAAFQSLLKNRRIMAEGLLQKIIEMQEKTRDFEYRWKDEDKSKPVIDISPNGEGKKRYYYDLDEINLKNYLSSSELEIIDRVQQIKFFDKLLATLEEKNGGSITREQFEKEEPVYWQRRFSKQILDDIISKTTGISPGNLYSTRYATAPTVLTDSPNKTENMPDLSKMLNGDTTGFVNDLVRVNIESINSLVNESIALIQNTNTPSLGVNFEEEKD